MSTTLPSNKLFLLGLCYILHMTLTLDAARSWGQGNDWKSEARRSFKSKKYNRPLNDERSRGPGHQRSNKPNIIIVITDDQDEMLGSMSTMTKTMKIMGQEGVRFNNSFVSTPMCCPSRSSFLTGLYSHNHHVYTNNDNCSGVDWQRIHEPRTFAKYLSDAGYRTGYFGKYLNEYNGTYIPPGWREWVGQCKNSQYYNYTLNFNDQKVKHDDNYYRDYFTDLIGNDSVTFLKQSIQYFPTKPVMMMLSVPAPHGPEDAAPQYQHMFENNTLHRTESWNYVNNSDKQWLLQMMKPLRPIDIEFTDMLQRKRLQTLQSVDSLMEKIHYQLRLLGELDNTYIIYTSDHGYHLGQFGIVKGKALPYDFDIRVPLFIRGPGILRDTVIPNPVGNVDLAPTILDMAGIEIPEHMDGRSLLKLIKTHRQTWNLQGDFVKTRRPWRDSFLVERGKVTKKLSKSIERKQDEKFFNEYEDALLPYANPKLRRTLRICKDPNNQPPCKEDQKWVCFRDHRDRKRIKKCRNYNKTVDGYNEFQKDSPLHSPFRTTHQSELSSSSSSSSTSKKCICDNDRKKGQGHGQGHGLFTNDKDLHQQYLRDLREDRGYGMRLLRNKRSIDNEELELRKKLIAQQLEMNRRRCRFYPNETFACDKDLTKDPEKWENHKIQLDEMIEETKKRLRNLKKIRKNMKKQRKHMSRYLDGNTSGDDDRYNSYYTDNLYNNNDDDDDYDDDNGDNDEDCDCDEDNDDFTVPDSLAKYGRNEFEGDDADSSELDDFNMFEGKVGKKRNCNREDLKCTTHHNEHWKTPPYWTSGNFCYCTNAVTNTYWCMRTINETHNFLYCEFIDSFLSFYDLKQDPHQLNNMIKTVDYGILQQLHDDLMELRRCQGWKQCNRNKNEEIFEKKRRRRRRINHRRESH
ncbi:Extracellular sulfatase Sulf-1 [Mactra antiquata]